MTRLDWDKPQDRTYETGASHGVLYIMNDDATYETGVAFNGLSGVELNPSGAEPTKVFADNINYLNILSAEEVSYTIKCYTVPKEFYQCDGYAEVIPGARLGQQTRKSFGFSYQTIVGNDVKDNKYGHKTHILYDSTAKPSQRSYGSVNESPEAMERSYECTAIPQMSADYDPCCHVELDSTVLPEAKLKAIEDVLYGTENAEPRLPTLAELISLLRQN